MKFKKYILATSLVAILSSTAVATTTHQAEAASDNTITANEYYNRLLKSELQSLVSELNVRTLSTASLEPYYKRQINIIGYKAKAALKSGNYGKMEVAKAELEAIYEEIAEALISTY
ncbi:TPA: complement inhibitor SCIN family protein [Staphylococcus pseudintermedius]